MKSDYLRRRYTRMPINNKLNELTRGIQPGHYLLIGEQLKKVRLVLTTNKAYGFDDEKGDIAFIPKSQARMITIPLMGTDPAIVFQLTNWFIKKSDLQLLSMEPKKPEVEVFETKVTGAHVYFDCDVDGVARHFEISCTRVCYLLKDIKAISFDKARFGYDESSDDAKVVLIDENEKPHVRYTKDLAADLAPQYAKEIIEAYVMEEAKENKIQETFLKSVA